MRCLCRLVVSALVALAVLMTAPAHALTTAVAPGELFVVEEAVGPGEMLFFSYQLHRDYLLTVHVKDRETGLLLQWWRDEESGVFDIASSDKKHVYDFVFDNSNSVLTSKNVNFEVRVVPDPEYVVDKAHVDPIETKIHALAAKMQKMKGMQVILRKQQKDHRATVEDASERVLLWSILQVVGFVVACGGQMLMLKLFLEKRRTV